MIGEFFFNIIFNFVSHVFEFLHDISWSVDTSALEYFVDVISVAGYMFPWGTVVAIAVTIFSLGFFRLAVSLIKTIWQLLPLA